jgi:Cu+-exporting ATPase
MGSGPKRAHVNYQCPCGCIGGVIYNAERPLSKAGACCCGRKLWVGEEARERLQPYLEAGVDYHWDIGAVILPWGEVAQAAMAWPKASETGHHHAEPDHVTVELVKDPVCGMMVDSAAAAAASDYRGHTYYFCAIGCKHRFDANPGQFVGAEAGSAPGLSKGSGRPFFDRLRRR